MDVLLDPTGDEDAKKNGRVLFEESQCGSDKSLNAFFVVALVETVQKDQIWSRY
jgi:hypothetical protein